MIYCFYKLLTILSGYTYSATVVDVEMLYPQLQTMQQNDGCDHHCTFGNCWLGSATGETYKHKRGQWRSATFETLLNAHSALRYEQNLSNVETPQRTATMSSSEMCACV